MTLEPLHGIRLRERMQKSFQQTRFNNETKSHMTPVLPNTNSVIGIIPLKSSAFLIRHTSTLLLFPHFLLLLSRPFSPQGVWFCSQEARQLGRKRLPPVRWVGPRAAGLRHRQLYQQGHAVTAPIKREKGGKPTQSGRIVVLITGWGCDWSVIDVVVSRVSFPSHDIYVTTPPTMRRLQRKLPSKKKNKL